MPLTVAPRLITSGETALAYGQTNCGAGQTVTLYEHAAGTPGYSVAGTTTTDPTGAYQITTPAVQSNAAFYSTIGAARSKLREVRVLAQVVLTGPPESASHTAGLFTGRRNAVTFTGTVSPADAGAEVVLQRENNVKGNEFHRIGRSVVTSAGTFAITHVFVAPGASDIRVVVRENHRNASSPSNVLSYQISQAENPALTILSEQDPVAFGGTTALTGIVPSEPNVPLTLWGRTAGGSFAQLATTSTNGEDAYTFAGVAPTASTFYQVRGGGRVSAVLYEGVKYLLTAFPSAPSVQSGQPLTFTGTVTPTVAGHVVYLERQNAAGTGYHVVAVGFVAADGSYSVTHTFYAPGTDVLRVRIPGDPEHGATASQTYSIPVTPVPSASKLGPEPSTNSGQPSTGQL